MISLLHAAFGINFVGMFFDIIAIGTSYWIKNGYTHAGLFVICNARECAKVSLSGRYHVMKIASCFAFLILLIASIMAIVYLCKATLRENIEYRKSLGILMIVGGALAFIGAMMGVGSTVGYSLGLAVIAGILSCIAGIMITARSCSATVTES